MKTTRRKTHRWKDVEKELFTPKQQAEARRWAEQELLELNLRSLREMVGPRDDRPVWLAPVDGLLEALKEHLGEDYDSDRADASQQRRDAYKRLTDFLWPNVEF